MEVGGCSGALGSQDKVGAGPSRSWDPGSWVSLKPFPAVGTGGQWALDWVPEHLILLSGGQRTPRSRTPCDRGGGRVESQDGGWVSPAASQTGGTRPHRQPPAGP